MQNLLDGFLFFDPLNTLQQVVSITLFIVFVILVFIGIMLLMREIYCWYWKVNERLRLQKETNEYLKNIQDLLSNADHNKKENSHTEINNKI